MAAVLTAENAPASVKQDWIIGRSQDLIWFIGSSLLGYLALFAFTAGIQLLTVFLIWRLIVDGPHVFATASRTYFDREARGKLGWRLWTIVPFLMVGPVMWAFGLGGLFVLLLLIWAQYHVAKQHLGFVMLYKRKTGERDDVTLDRRFLLGSLLLPLGLFLCRHADVPRSEEIITLAFVAYLPCAVFYITRQVRKRLAGKPGNFPKLLLFAVVIPLHWIALLYPGKSLDSLFIAGVATNIGHSLQYYRLTWFHNHNRYANQSRFGFASLISTRVVWYLLTAVILNAIFWGIPHYTLSGNMMLLSAFSGLNMTHFYLDSKIWRTRNDPELAQALRL